MTGKRNSFELTRRELECLKELAKGGEQRDVAARLFVEVETVKFHLHNVRRKLGVHTSLEAVIEANKRGIIDLDDNNDVDIKLTEREFIPDDGEWWAVSFNARRMGGKMEIRDFYTSRST